MQHKILKNLKFDIKLLNYNKYDSFLFLIRHGQTVDNIAKINQGQTDGKLTNLGIEQAQKIGSYLKDINFDLAVVSDLGRTKDTFNNINLNLNQKISNIEFNKILREKEYGELTGKSNIYIDSLIEESKTEIRKYKFSNEESWEDVYTRAEGYLNLIFEKCLDNNKNIISVSHSGFIMEFLNVYNSYVHNKKPIFDESFKNCCICLLGINKNKKIEIIKPQISEHLE